MKISKTLLPAAALVALFASCQDENLGYTEQDVKSSKYAQQFKEVFGDVDPNHDWTFASQVSASIDNDGVNKDYKLTIYTAAPISSTSAILYQKTFTAGKSADITFDIPKTSKKVYVEVELSDGTKPVQRYCDVDDLQLSISSVLTRAANNVTLGDPTVITNNNNTGSGENVPVKYDLYDISSQVSRTDGATVQVSDIDAIVGRGKVFCEYGHTKVSPCYCNLCEYHEYLNAGAGAEYVMAEDGPVEIDIIFGGTQNNNLLGYFYYTDGTSYEEAVKKPHYILCSARPQDNVKAGENFVEGGMALPENYIKAYDNNPCDATNKLLTAGHYKLSYFGENGTGAGDDEFPEGTHIVFFLFQNAWTQGGHDFSNPSNIENAVPAINALEYKFSAPHSGHADDADWYTLPSRPAGLIDAVTYSWGGQTVLAFEDRDPDQDMNDMLIYIQGNIERNQTEIKKEADAYEWIVACEDLGGSFDYDFNDVVFGVRHYTSKKTMFSSYYLNGTLVTETPSIVDYENFILVTPYAAGGSLKSNLYYNSALLGEVHSLINPNVETTLESGQMPILNAKSYEYNATPVIYQLASDEEFTMSNTPGATTVNKFSIRTIKAGETEATVANTASIITVPDLASEEEKAAGNLPESRFVPQMLVLPQGWDWPAEEVCINEVYPSFKDWTAQQEANGWIGTPQGQYITNPYKIENIDGSGSSSDPGSGTDDPSEDDGKVTPTITTEQVLYAMTMGDSPIEVEVIASNDNYAGLKIYNSCASSETTQMCVTATYDATTHKITLTPSTTAIGTARITVRIPATTIDGTEYKEAVYNFNVSVSRWDALFEVRQSDGTTVISETDGVISVVEGSTVAVGVWSTAPTGQARYVAGDVVASISETEYATVSGNANYQFEIAGVKKGETTLTIKHKQSNLIAETSKTYTVKVVEASAIVLPEPTFSLKIGDIDLVTDGYSVPMGSADLDFSINVTEGDMNYFEVTSAPTSVAAIIFENAEGTGNYYGHKIKIKSVGTATITVKHKYVANTWAEVTKTFTLTVTEAGSGGGSEPEIDMSVYGNTLPDGVLTQDGSNAQYQIANSILSGCETATITFKFSAVNTNYYGIGLANALGNYGWNDPYTFKWKDKDGEDMNSAPTQPGVYQLSLDANAVSAIMAKAGIGLWGYSIDDVRYKVVVSE